MTTTIIHEWNISIDREVDETTTEVRDGQPVTVTRKVKKPIITKMALKRPTRREMRQAELFYGKRFNHFVNEGFLTVPIMTNKQQNLTGDLLSVKDKERIETLRSLSVKLDNDLARAVNETAEVKEKLQAELSTARTQLLDIYSANQAVYSQTAEKRAERDLNDWFAYNLTLIDRGGWQPYFEGKTFEEKEESMWKLEESNDPFYTVAVTKISTYVQFFNMGLDTTEKFKLAEEELQRQLDSGKPKVEAPPAAEAPDDGPPAPSVS